MSPIVRSARQRRRHRPRWGTASHWAEPGRSCLAQRCSAPPAAGPTGTAGRGAGHGGSCPAQRDQATSTADPFGTRAVRGLRERRAGACIEPEQAPQGTTGRGLGKSRGPRVDRMSSTITERSRGRRTRRSNCHPLNNDRRSRRGHRLQPSRTKLFSSCVRIKRCKRIESAVDTTGGIKELQGGNSTVIYRPNLCVSFLDTAHFQ